MLLYFSPVFFSEKNPDYNQFSKSLNVKEIIAEQQLTKLVEAQPIDLSYSEKFTQLNKTKGLSFYIIDRNKLIYWTNRSIQFSGDLNEFEKDNGLVKLKNGWYQYLIKKSNQKTYLALILIKNDYNIKNKYLTNTFHHSFRIEDNQEIITFKNENSTEITDVNGESLLGLRQIKQRLFRGRQPNGVTRVL